MTLLFVRRANSRTSDRIEAIGVDLDPHRSHQIVIKSHVARDGRAMEGNIEDPRREKTLENVGIPRAFFVAGAGFEPATFGL
jgi:hypothetical protein